MARSDYKILHDSIMGLINIHVLRGNKIWQYVNRGGEKMNLSTINILLEGTSGLRESNDNEKLR